MTNADFTIRDVLAWARTKPADGRYEYESNTNCALCQFLRETGRATNPSVGGATWKEWSGSAPYYGKSGARHQMPEDLRGPLQAGTFGTLVSRLEKLCPETVVTSSDWSRLDAYLTDIEQVSA